MIHDKIENIDLYSEIPVDAAAYIKNLSNDISCGKYYVNQDIFVNIDEYLPRRFENCKFEAHKKYIDIQIVLQGCEYLDYTLSESLEVDIPYDTEKDIAFFTEPDLHVNRVVLELGNFVLLYPHEAHKPQIRAFDGPQEVKKAVVKIPVSVTNN